MLVLIPVKNYLFLIFLKFICLEIKNYLKMKLKFFVFLLSIVLAYSQGFQNGPINLHKNIKNFKNIKNIVQNIPARFSQALSTSQIKASEKIASSSNAEAGENPIFTLNIHAPQETTDEIIGIKYTQMLFEKMK